MLDINFIRQNPGKVKKACKNKQANIDIDLLLKIDKDRLKSLKELENMRAELNKLSKNKPDSTTIKKAKKLKTKIKSHKKTFTSIEKNFLNLMLQIPNIPFDDVPIGKDESGNIVIRTVKKKPQFNFKIQDYLTIAEKLDIIDVKRAAKVSGSRFGYLKNEAVLLEFALVNLVFNLLGKEGFVPIVPPVMMKPKMMEGMGYIDTKENINEVYFLKKDNLVLIGTSEQSIGPMYKDEVLSKKELPRRYVGFSTCFRREAGSYGKDTKGILRVHQFDKAEMFSFCKPEDSTKEHQFFLSLEEKLMQKLKLPYQVVQMCTGDLGTPAAAKYDIEAWMPSQNKYRETHSTSNSTDFQARRLNIRYRNLKTGKLEFVHTVNGTAFAIGRTLIAIIENYQQKDGSVKIPEVLQKYLGFKSIPKR